jgi:hypothetical protein
MSIKIDKKNLKNNKNAEMEELVVYEPIRRSDKESENENTIKEKLKLTKDFCGLYNRGK